MINNNGNKIQEENQSILMIILIRVREDKFYLREEIMFNLEMMILLIRKEKSQEFEIKILYYVVLIFISFISTTFLFFKLLFILTTIVYSNFYHVI